MICRTVKYAVIKCTILPNVYCVQTSSQFHLQHNSGSSPPCVLESDGLWREAVFESYSGSHHPVVRSRCQDCERFVLWVGAVLMFFVLFVVSGSCRCSCCFTDYLGRCKCMLDGLPCMVQSSEHVVLAFARMLSTVHCKKAFLRK